MASVSIAERLLRQIVREVEAISGIGDVVRQTMHGKWWEGSAWKQHLEPSDATVVFQGDQELEQAIGGDNAPCYLRMSVAVAIIGGHSEDDHTPTDPLIRNWVALTRNALMSNPSLIEDTSLVRLAIDSRIVNVPELVSSEEPREMNAFTFLDVDYICLRNNAAVGPGITELTE